MKAQGDPNLTPKRRRIRTRMRGFGIHVPGGDLCRRSFTAPNERSAQVFEPQCQGRLERQDQDPLAPDLPFDWTLDACDLAEAWRRFLPAVSR